MRYGCCALLLVASLHLTSACYAQSYNNISSLAGVFFPAGLKTLWVVSFDSWSFCFAVCGGDVCGACDGCCAFLLVAALHLTFAFRCRPTTKSAAFMVLFFLQH